MFRFGILGSGRIGRMHAGLVAAQSDATVSWCYDVDPERARETAELVGASAAATVEDVLEDDAVDAVLIASPTNTHVELILKSAEAGKPILCEKPIDVDLDKVEECAAALKKYDVPIQLGFNRRFDPSHRKVWEAVQAGAIGPLELLVITSRDPGPPPPRAILEACGGLFRDTTIHDFDMARFILGEEPVEVFAMAANRVRPGVRGTQRPRHSHGGDAHWFGHTLPHQQLATDELRLRPAGGGLRGGRDGPLQQSSRHRGVTLRRRGHRDA